MDISQLNANIGIIENLFMPDIKTDDDYEENDYLKVRAYVSLAHSEFENFLECRALEVSKESINKYETTGDVDRVILGLVCFSGSLFDSPPEKRDLNEKKLYLMEKVKNAYTTFNRNVKLNNGIKEKDILKLLLPLGYPIEKLDDLFLTEMNNFGSLRGEIAHTSNVEQIAKKRMDPVVMKKKVHDIINFLKDVDDVLRDG